MAKQWRCFFCDEVFKTRREAFDHFGEDNCAADVPACVDPLRNDEKARMKELREARQFYFKAAHQEERADELAWALEQHDREIRRYFGDDCHNLWSAGDRYSNLKFENKMLREEIKALKMEKEGITEQDIYETSPARL